MIRSLNRKIILGVVIIIVPILGLIFILVEINLINQAKTNTIEKARVVANNIILIRQWITDCKGGVFLRTDSNGALDMQCKIKYRLNTPIGTLQMFTPSMVTQKLSQYSIKEKLYSFRLSSLDPINSINQADDFEKNALQQFEKENNTEIYQFTDSSLDFMVPLYKSEGCAKCHTNKNSGPSKIIGGLRVTIPYTQTRKFLNRNALMLGGASICITFITIGVLLFLINIIVLKPLKELEIKSREISQGNLDARVTINTNDELERLGNNFNTMASNLSQGRDRLKEKISNATRELARANKDLLKLDTLKTDFLTNMSHELRTPLTAAKGSITYLERTLQEPDALKYVGIVEKNLSRLTWLVNNLFDFTKLEAEKIDWEFNKENISQLVEEAIEIISPIATKKNVSIEFHNPGDIYAVIDLERIEQVLINILDNAIKFSMRNTIVEVNLKKDNKHITISIKNYGQGIDPQHLNNIFKKFYTGGKKSEQNKEGTGLGLAISKAIVNAHKGKIKVKSIPGNSTCFYVILPLQLTLEVST